MLDDESPTSANLGNDHEFIINEYSPLVKNLCSKWSFKIEADGDM